MTDPKCSCAQFERLEGASVPSYIAAFLEGTDAHHSAAKQTRFRCRVCGREWERRAPETKSEGSRTSLVRVN